MSRVAIINVPKNNSSDIVWMAWYDALKSKFGRKRANTLFSANWDAQQGAGSDANSSKLRGHLRDKGKLEISGSVLGEIKDKALDLGDWIGDAFVMGRYVSYALGGILVCGIGLFVYNLAKDPDKAVRIGTAVATRGMSEAVPKK